MSALEQDRDQRIRVLVTGATGLVGNNLTRLLLQRSINVRVLARKSSDSRPLEGLDVELATGDVTDPVSVATAMEGVSAVIHSAGCVLLGWKNAAVHEAVNHQGTVNVAQAAREAGARMVYVSTINTLGVGTKDQAANEQWAAAPNIPCPYVVSKQAGEAAVRQQIEAGLDAVIVHPGLMFGPWDWKPSSGRMILEVARNFTPMAPKGGCSVCDVRDVAEGILARTGESPHRSSLCAGWPQCNLFEVVATHRRYCRREPTPVPQRAVDPHVLGRSGDLWGWLTGKEPDVNSAAVKLSDCYHYFDSTRAQQELLESAPTEESLRRMAVVNRSRLREVVAEATRLPRKWIAYGGSSEPAGSVPKGRL